MKNVSALLDGPKTGANSLGSDNEWIVNCEPVRQLTKGRVALPKVSWRGQRSIVERFWEKVNLDGPVHPTLGTACWLWTGCVVARYGQIGLGHPSTAGSKRWKTHRFSWELHNGSIADGLHVCHHCDNPLCVRPAHLFLGTAQDNALDASRKGRKNAFGRQKLNADDVRIIRSHVAEQVPVADIASAFAISEKYVRRIANRTAWAHLHDATVAAAS